MASAKVATSCALLGFATVDLAWSPLDWLGRGPSGVPRCGWAHRRRGTAEHGAGRGRHVGVAGAWGPGLKPRALRLAQWKKYEDIEAAMGHRALLSRGVLGRIVCARLRMDWGACRNGRCGTACDLSDVAIERCRRGADWPQFVRSLGPTVLRNILNAPSDRVDPSEEHK